MKPINFVSIIIAGMLSVTVTNAQENNPTVKNNSDEIFNSMMQTMPKEMKARIDSASIIQNSKKTVTNSDQTVQYDQKSSPLNSSSSNTSLDKLPDNVRQQVLKTMQQLEQEQNERILQFKESKAMRNGN
jgi:hypothetical protein